MTLLKRIGGCALGFATSSSVGFLFLAACSDAPAAPAIDGGVNDGAVNTTPDGGGAVVDARSDAALDDAIVAKLPGRFIVDFDVRGEHVVVLSRDATQNHSLSYGDVGKQLKTIYTFEAKVDSYFEYGHVHLDDSHAYFTALMKDDSSRLARCPVTGCTTPEEVVPSYTALGHKAFSVQDDGIFLLQRPEQGSPYAVRRIDKTSKAATSLFATDTDVHYLEDNGTSFIAYGFYANSPLYVGGRAEGGAATLPVDRNAHPFFAATLGRTAIYARSKTGIVTCAVAGCGGTPTSVYEAPPARVVDYLHSDRGTPERLVFTLSELQGNFVPDRDVPLSTCEASRCAATLTSLPMTISNRGDWTESGLRFSGGYVYWIDTRNSEDGWIGIDTVLRAKLP